MGQGTKGKKDPLNNLFKKFGGQKDTAVLQRTGIYGASYYISHRTTKKIHKTKNGVYLLDIMQNMEGGDEFKGAKIHTGHQMYRKLKFAILDAFKSPGIRTVIVSMDIGTNPNQTKDLCYYTINGKRRIKKGKAEKAMPTVRETLITKFSFPCIIQDRKGNKHNHNRCPCPWKWKEFKLNPIMRNEVNCFFAEELAQEQHLSTGQGTKTIIFDNYIPRRDIKKHPKEIKACSLILTIHDGVVIGKDYDDASMISEGELSFRYLADVADKLVGVKHDTVFYETNDQDIFFIFLLGLLNYKEGKERDNYLKKQFVNVAKVRTVSTRFTRYTRLNQLYYNLMSYYKENYPRVKYPIYVEFLLFHFGGCDFHDGPFKGIGYKKIIKEFNIFPNISSKMIKLHTVNFPMQVVKQGKWEHIIAKCESLGIDEQNYESFAKNIHQGSKRGKYYPGQINARKRMVIAREIMFTALCIRHIPRLRREYDVSVMFNPYEQNGWWGYQKSFIPNGPDHKVCVQAEMVPNFF